MNKVDVWILINDFWFFISDRWVLTERGCKLPTYSQSLSSIYQFHFLQKWLTMLYLRPWTWTKLWLNRVFKKSLPLTCLMHFMWFITLNLWLLTFDSWPERSKDLTTYSKNLWWTRLDLCCDLTTYSKNIVFFSPG